jgi:hypothetical protein
VRRLSSSPAAGPLRLAAACAGCRCHSQIQQLLQDGVGSEAAHAAALMQADEERREFEARAASLPAPPVDEPKAAAALMET